jgi:hypothetical protein
VVVNLDALHDVHHGIRFNGHDDARERLNAQIQAAIDIANGVEDDAKRQQRLRDETEDRAISQQLSQPLGAWPAGVLPIFVPLPAAGVRYRVRLRQPQLIDMDLNQAGHDHHNQRLYHMHQGNVAFESHVTNHCNQSIL